MDSNSETATSSAQLAAMAKPFDRQAEMATDLPEKAYKRTMAAALRKKGRSSEALALEEGPQRDWWDRKPA